MTKEDFYEHIHSVDHLAGWWDEKGKCFYVQNKYCPHKLFCMFFHIRQLSNGNTAYGYILNRNETDWYYRMKIITNLRTVNRVFEKIRALKPSD